MVLAPANPTDATMPTTSGPVERDNKPRNSTVTSEDSSSSSSSEDSGVAPQPGLWSTDYFHSSYFFVGLLLLLSLTLNAVFAFGCLNRQSASESEKPGAKIPTSSGGTTTPAFEALKEKMFNLKIAEKAAKAAVKTAEKEVVAARLDLHAEQAVFRYPDSKSPKESTFKYFNSRGLQDAIFASSAISDMAKATGISYRKVETLRAKFWELAEARMKMSKQEGTEVPKLSKKEVNDMLRKFKRGELREFFRRE